MLRTTPFSATGNQDQIAGMPNNVMRERLFKSDHQA